MSFDGDVVVLGLFGQRRLVVTWWVWAASFGGDVAGLGGIVRRRYGR
jgi:hypothetical protein